MRVDLTINLPTIISVIASIGAVCVMGLNVYSDLNNRQLRTDLAVIEIRTRLDKTETAIGAVKTDQAAQMQTLRTDMKSDISEIKDMLNRLIFGAAPAPAPHRQQQLSKDWSK